MSKFQNRKGDASFYIEGIIFADVYMRAMILFQEDLEYLPGNLYNIEQNRIKSNQTDTTEVYL